MYKNNFHLIYQGNNLSVVGCKISFILLRKNYSPVKISQLKNTLKSALKKLMKTIGSCSLDIFLCRYSKNALIANTVVLFLSGLLQN
jgi:hypothetical protein